MEASFTSADGSRRRNPPERCPRPLYSQDCPEEKLPENHQDENLMDIKVEVKDEAEEETDLRGDQQDGLIEQNPLETCPRPLYSQDCPEEKLPDNHQDENLMDIKVEVKDEAEEETDLWGDQQDGLLEGNPPERCPRPLYSQDCAEEKLPENHQQEKEAKEKVVLTNLKMEMPHWYQRMRLNVSRLIVQVESQPILWDAAEEGYCDRNQTKDAWTLVCRNLYSEWDSATITEQEVIVKDVKNWWRTVRDRFKKWLNKVEQSGSSPTNKKCPYYDELQFLLTSRELRPSEGNIPVSRQTSAEESEETSAVVDTQDSSIIETSEDHTSQSSSQAASQLHESNISNTLVAPRRVNRRRNRSSAQPSVEIEALSMIQRVEMEDEFDHIGVSLANRIRSLPKQWQPSFMAAMYTLLDAYENPSPIASVSAIVTAIQQNCRPPPPPTEYSNVRHSHPPPPLNPQSQPYGINSHANAHSANYHPANVPYSSSYMSYLQMTPPPCTSSQSSYVNSTPSTGSSNSSEYTTRPHLLNLE